MKRFGPRNRHEWRTGNVQRQQEHSTTEEATIRAVLPQAKGYLGLPEARLEEPGESQSPGGFRGPAAAHLQASI